MAALLSEETEGKEVLPSGLRGLTAYRYWQRRFYYTIIHWKSLW